jgi:hypothetical protein
MWCGRPATSLSVAGLSMKVVMNQAQNRADTEICGISDLQKVALRDDQSRVSFGR